MQVTPYLAVADSNVRSGMRLDEIYGCEFESDCPPMPGMFLTFMPADSSGLSRHYKVLAIRHGVRIIASAGNVHSTVELIVEVAEFDSFSESVRVRS